MYRFCPVCVSVCVCLSGCQKLIISSLHHILHSPGPIQACPSGPAVSVRGFFAHLTDFVQLLITFKHCLGMLTEKQHTHTSTPTAGCAIQPWADSSTRVFSVDTESSYKELPAVLMMLTVTLLGTLALPKLNLQFLTVHDYLLRNFHLFRLESTCTWKHWIYLYGNFATEINCCASH